jgi:hypothetical protein
LCVHKTPIIPIGVSLPPQRSWPVWAGAVGTRYARLVCLGATFPGQLGLRDVCAFGVDFDPETLDDLIQAGMYLCIVRVEA